MTPKPHQKTEYVSRDEYEALARRVDAIAKKLDHATDEIEQLHEAGSPSGRGDQYAEAIFTYLDDGQTVTLNTLKSILINATSIQTDETATQRAKQVIERNRSNFTECGHATWRFADE